MQGRINHTPAVRRAVAHKQRAFIRRKACPFLGDEAFGQGGKVGIIRKEGSGDFHPFRQGASRQGAFAGRAQPVKFIAGRNVRGKNRHAPHPG